MIGGEIKNISCSYEKSLKWRENECTHIQEVVIYKFANQRLLFHSVQNWIFGGRFDVGNNEFSFIQRQDLKIQQSRTSKICLIQVKWVKTVRNNHLCLNAFVFLIRYVSHSDAYRHVYCVVKGESQLHKVLQHLHCLLHFLSLPVQLLVWVWVLKIDCEVKSN